MVSGESNLSADELQKVRDKCLDEDEQGGIPDERGGDDLPPDDVLECIVSVLGEVSTGSISEADKDLLDKSCGTPEGDSGEQSDDGANDQTNLTPRRLRSVSRIRRILTVRVSIRFSTRRK